MQEIGGVSLVMMVLRPALGGGMEREGGLDIPSASSSSERELAGDCGSKGTSCLRRESISPSEYSKSRSLPESWRGGMKRHALTMDAGTTYLWQRNNRERTMRYYHASVIERVGTYL